MSADHRRLRLQRHDLPGGAPGRGAVEMHDGGLGRHPRAGAAEAGAAAEIRLLAVHHEARIESAELLPEVATDQEEAALHHVDLALVAAIPVAHLFRIEEGAAPEDQREPRGAAEQAPERQGAEDAAGVQRPVAVERAAAPDPGLGRPLGEGDDPVDRMVEHQRVGVQQQDVRAASPRGRRGCCPWRTRGSPRSRSAGGRERRRRSPPPSRRARRCRRRSARRAPWSPRQRSSGTRSSSRGCCS